MSRAFESVALVAQKHKYRIGDSKLKQKRVLGRRVFEPQIDLSKYVVSAKIDTLVIRAQFEAHKQERHVSNKLAAKFGIQRPWIKKDEATSTFMMWEGNITFQDFPYDQLYNLCSSDEYLPKPEILQMDIAVDFQSKVTDPALREVENNAILDVIARHLWVERSLTQSPEGLPRLVWGRRKATNEKMIKATSRLGGRQPHFVPIGTTAYIGARRAAICYKLYHKKADQRRNDGAVTLLPPSKWVARCEVTIRQPALCQLGITDALSLSRFDFKRLTSLFRFRSPTFDTGEGDQEFLQMIKGVRSKILLNGFLLAGMTEYRKREHGIDPRNKYGYSVSYGALNERLRMALRRIK